MPDQKEKTPEADAEERKIAYVVKRTDLSLPVSFVLFYLCNTVPLEVLANAVDWTEEQINAADKKNLDVFTFGLRGAVKMGAAHALGQRVIALQRGSVAKLREEDLKAVPPEPEPETEDPEPASE